MERIREFGVKIQKIEKLWADEIKNKRAAKKSRCSNKIIRK